MTNPHDPQRPDLASANDLGSQPGRGAQAPQSPSSQGQTFISPIDRFLQSEGTPDNPEHEPLPLGGLGESFSPIDHFLEDKPMVPATPDFESDSFQPAPHVEIGTPEGAESTWDGQQKFPDTCAIHCQEYVLEVMTGQEFDESQLVQEALEHGWYTPGGGTPADNVGDLLELHGVGVERYHNASVFHLANELSQGHQVIVGVDAEELWENPILGGLLERVLDALGFSGADHAVLVTGIETTDTGQTNVVIADPGTGEPAASYPIEQFLYAWQDSNCEMVTTIEAAPHGTPGMEFFDYAAGCIDTIAGTAPGMLLDTLEGAVHVGVHVLFNYVHGQLGIRVQAPLVSEPTAQDLSHLSQAPLSFLENYAQEHDLDWLEAIVGGTDLDHSESFEMDSPDDELHYAFDETDLMDDALPENDFDDTTDHFGDLS